MQRVIVMGIGKLFKISFYSIITIFFFGSITAYYMDIIPTSFGIHSKIYKSSNVAMDGYDIVNYYTHKTANKGDVTFNYKLGEDNWFFISASNKRSFQAKPQRYYPQFGGYCAYTMSFGFTHPPDPKSWRMYNGKLYFFKDEEAKNLAIADWKNVLKSANLHWKN